MGNGRGNKSRPSGQRWTPWRSTSEMTFALRWTSSRDSDRAASMRAISYKCISVERRRVYREGCPNHMQMRIRKIMRNIHCLGASMAPARWHLPSQFPPPPQAQSRVRIGAPAPPKPVTKVQHSTLSPSPPGRTLPASCIPTLLLPPPKLLTNVRVLDASVVTRIGCPAR